VLYSASLLPCAAVLRDISGGTSYQTVRLVFRHYRHLPPSSCTSERLRASSPLSSTFTPSSGSSQSFGSHTSAPTLAPHSAAVVSLVRVPRRAESNSLPPHTFIFHLPLFILRSPYFSPIGHHPVFCLRWPSPPQFALHYQAALLFPVPDRAYRSLPLCEPHSLRVRRNRAHTTIAARRNVTTQAPPLSLAATRRILVSFFSSPY